jgi:hypothetical protein
VFQCARIVDALTVGHFTTLSCAAQELEWAQLWVWKKWQQLAEVATWLVPIFACHLASLESYWLLAALKRWITQSQQRLATAAGSSSDSKLCFVNCIGCGAGHNCITGQAASELEACVALLMLATGGQVAGNRR